MPRIIDKKEKKAKILEASIRVFAKKGLSNTKMADIAEAADVGKGTIYEYFRSKDEILEASFQYFVEGVEKILSGKLAGIADPRRSGARGCRSGLARHAGRRERLHGAARRAARARADALQ